MLLFGSSFLSRPALDIVASMFREPRTLIGQLLRGVYRVFFASALCVLAVVGTLLRQLFGVFSTLPIVGATCF